MNSLSSDLIILDHTDNKLLFDYVTNHFQSLNKTTGYLL